MRSCSSFDLPPLRFCCWPELAPRANGGRVAVAVAEPGPPERNTFLFETLDVPDVVAPNTELPRRAVEPPERATAVGVGHGSRFPCWAIHTHRFRP